MTVPNRDERVVDELVDRLRAERALFERVLLRLPEVTSGFDADRIRHGITELAVELCGGDFALLVGADEDEASGTWAGIRPAEAPSVWRAPLLAAAFRGGPVVRVDDVGRWVRTERAAARYGTLNGETMVRSYLVAPVIGHIGDVLAALYIGHRRAHAFGAHHERLIESMARFLATALDNADRFHERDRVAGALQETLLPPLLPTIAGIDLAARYRAAPSASTQVGGDFYDVFRAGDRWAAVIGDVCGAGPEAAAVTGVARYTIRALAATTASPAATLVALNDALSVQREERRFLTAVHLLFDASSPSGIELTFARAGHPPPVLLRVDGSIDLLDEPQGTLLGVFEDISVEDRTMHLERGDALVLYTDGVVEARDPDGVQYGYQRLQEVVAAAAGRPSAGIARRLEAAVADFTGGDIIDDVAILVLRAI